MSNHNICLYKEVKKKYTGCNLKTTEFLDCALIGVCGVIRSNTVCVLENAICLGHCYSLAESFAAMLHRVYHQSS